jgi:hypothetical protein
MNLIQVTERYAKIAGGKKKSTKAGAMDQIAKRMGPLRPAAAAAAMPPAAATASPSKKAGQLLPPSLQNQNRQKKMQRKIT